jgi:hypothetical protein
VVSAAAHRVVLGALGSRLAAVAESEMAGSHGEGGLLQLEHAPGRCWPLGVSGEKLESSRLVALVLPQ